ncbi:MAG: hypothetical protein J7L39_02490 [Candidatus Aenigmarchaeota archaeon]|nr:hypothetical protein [Candidatus Aenigmarchaeota archaeon]
MNELYYHWNRQNDPVYKPKIHFNVGKKVGLLWQSFGNPIKTVGMLLKSLRVNGLRYIKEFSQLIFRISFI